MRAAMDRGPVFGDQQRALGKVEHLTLLVPHRRLRIERRTAMLADAGHVGNHEIGIGDLPQRVALVALPDPNLHRPTQEATPLRRSTIADEKRSRLGSLEPLGLSRGCARTSGPVRDS